MEERASDAPLPISLDSAVNPSAAPLSCGDEIFGASTPPIHEINCPNKSEAAGTTSTNETSSTVEKGVRPALCTAPSSPQQPLAVSANSAISTSHTNSDGLKTTASSSTALVAVNISKRSSAVEAPNRLSRYHPPVTIKDVKRPEIPFPLHATPPNVLSEEDYVAALTDIIERDYFPDLSRLRTLNQLEKARANGDFMESHRLEQALQAMTPSAYSSNASYHGDDNQPIISRPHGPFGGAERGIQTVQLPNGALHQINTNCSLDAFQASYTSEDNASFEELTAGEKKRKESMQRWIEDREYEENLKNAAINQETIEGKKSLHLSGNIHTARNALMFHPKYASNEGQITPVAVGTQRDLESRNSRFSAKEKESEVLLMARVEQMQNQRDAEYMGKQRDRMLSEGKFDSSAEAKGSYGYVHTPMLAPGVGPDQSPIMTWGKVASTPLVIASNADADDAGPAFKIPDPLPREKAAEKLQNEASLKLSNRKRKRQSENFYGMYDIRRSSTSLSGAITEGGAYNAKNANSRLQELSGKSPLVRQMMKDYKQSPNLVDTQLRNAYSGRRRTGMSTPGARSRTFSEYRSATPSSDISLFTPVHRNDAPSASTMISSRITSGSASYTTMHPDETESSTAASTVETEACRNRSTEGQPPRSVSRVTTSTDDSNNVGTSRDGNSAQTVTDNLLHI